MANVRVPIPRGRELPSDHAYQAVLGSVVAKQAGISVGDRININCGISGNDTHNEQSFLITGILDSTGTPNDHVVFVNIEGFYLLEGHALKPSNEVIAIWFQEQPLLKNSAGKKVTGSPSSVACREA